MEEQASCEYLEWDSRFFGLRIARAKEVLLTEKSVIEISAWCELNRIDCLYFLADSSDAQTTRLAERNNFNLVDIRISLEWTGTVTPTLDSAESRVRDAFERDIPALRSIARSSHRDSRFYYDGNFRIFLCDALYETWIEKSCMGSADKVLVGEDKGEPTSYITCHLKELKTGQIGLLGVGDGAQGKGLGRALVEHALLWFTEQGVRNVEVTTQGRNVRAQRLYQRTGFVTSRVGLWYHKWFHHIGNK